MLRNVSSGVALVGVSLAGYSYWRSSTKGSMNSGQPEARLISLYTSATASCDVVFVHGLSLGGPPKTWVNADGVEWPAAWLGPRLREANVWSFEYPNDASQWLSASANMTVSARGRDFANTLVRNKIGEQPFVIVAHSMGGLVAKAALNDDGKLAGKLAGNLAGIVFLATPHRGSDVADFVSRYFRNGLRTSISVEQLQTANEDEFERLNETFKGLNRRILSLAEAHPLSFDWPILTWLWDIVGTYVMRNSPNVVVTEASSRIQSDNDQDPVFESFQSVDKNHFSITQPRDEQDAVYENILTFVQRCVSPTKVHVRVQLYESAHQHHATDATNAAAAASRIERLASIPDFKLDARGLNLDDMTEFAGSARPFAVWEHDLKEHVRKLRRLRLSSPRPTHFVLYGQSPLSAYFLLGTSGLDDTVIVTRRGNHSQASWVATDLADTTVRAPSGNKLVLRKIETAPERAHYRIALLFVTLNGSYSLSEDDVKTISEDLGGDQVIAYRLGPADSNAKYTLLNAETDAVDAIDVATVKESIEQALTKVRSECASNTKIALATSGPQSVAYAMGLAVRPNVDGSPIFYEKVSNRYVRATGHTKSVEETK